jgi:hypothetical protein
VSVSYSVYVVDGIIEVTIGNGKDPLSSGDLGIVPVMERLNFRKGGTNTAKVIGFFFSTNVVNPFQKAFMPANFGEFDTTKLLPAPKEAATTTQTF